jgi:hypothetical protein
LDGEVGKDRGGLIAPALEEMRRTDDERLPDARQTTVETLQPDLSGRCRVVGGREGGGDRQGHGAFASSYFGDEEGIDAACEELQGGLDRVGLGPKGLTGERRKSDLVVFAMGIVKSRELLLQQLGEGAAVVGDEIGRVPAGEVVSAVGNRAGLKTMEGVVVEAEDGEAEAGLFHCEGRRRPAGGIGAFRDGCELALEDSFGEERRVATRVVGLEPVAVEHAGGEGEGDVNRLRRHGRLEAGAKKLAGGEGRSDRSILPRTKRLDRRGEVEGSKPIVDKVSGSGGDGVRVRACLRKGRERVGMVGPFPDRPGEGSRCERLCSASADEEDLTEDLKLGVGKAPGADFQEMTGQKVG